MSIAKSVGAIAAILLVAGCTNDQSRGRCPPAVVLAPTSSLTVFRKGVQDDPAGEQYTAQLTNVVPSCDFDKRELTTDSSLEIQFRAIRAPGGDAAQYTVPYFVAVTQDGDHIIAKHMFLVQFAFEAGQTEATFSDTVASTHIDIAKGKKAGEYEILVGLQLTASQLEYNKKMKRYAP